MFGWCKLIDPCHTSVEFVHNFDPVLCCVLFENPLEHLYHLGPLLNIHLVLSQVLGGLDISVESFYHLLVELGLDVSHADIRVLGLVDPVKWSSSFEHWSASCTGG